MTGKELMSFCNGKIVPISFTERIENLDSRFENCMKAYIVGISLLDDDEITIIVEERDFAEYNKSIEKPLWQNSETEKYDLKFSDSYYGERWTGTHTFYDCQDELCGNFTLIDEDRMRLFQQYQKEKSKLTYVGWLEDKILNK